MKMSKQYYRLSLFTAVLLSGYVTAQLNDGMTSEEVNNTRDNATDIRGSGAFPATKVVEEGLPNQVVYRPADLDSLGQTKLGVYVFGNGSCTDDAAHSRFHVMEVASHGYLAIVPGQIYTGVDAIPRPAENASPPTSPSQLTAAIDWALAENDSPESPYFGLIDPKAIAASGYSCGGIQALISADDPRVATVVIMNSGLINGRETTMTGSTVNKDILEKLHTPIIYILGGETDIAYENGMDDYSRINHVPAAVANINKGHGGTYWEPNGGPAAEVAVSWLEWQLRDNEQAAQMFMGEHCGLCQNQDWEFEKKGF
jgi:hypothetical protein